MTALAAAISRRLGCRSALSDSCLMGHPVIPAPTRFDAGDGPGFAFRPGTVIAYADAGIAPLVGRFCAQVTRRTGLRLTPVPGDHGAG